MGASICDGYTVPMGMRILIDGYNLIATLWGMGRGTRELARQREELLSLLGPYREARGHPMTVVFDGWREGEPLGSRTRERGITVQFSPKGVTADEVIRDLVRDKGPGTLVVSADKRVLAWSREAGADGVDSATFHERIRAARAVVGDPEEGRDEDRGGWSGDTVKRGNPRRRSKKERTLGRRLDKL